MLAKWSSLTCLLSLSASSALCCSPSTIRWSTPSSVYVGGKKKAKRRVRSAPCSTLHGSRIRISQCTQDYTIHLADEINIAIPWIYGYPSLHLLCPARSSAWIENACRVLTTNREDRVRSPRYELALLDTITARSNCQCVLVWKANKTNQNQKLCFLFFSEVTFFIGHIRLDGVDARLSRFL